MNTIYVVQDLARGQRARRLRAPRGCARSGVAAAEPAALLREGKGLGFVTAPGVPELGAMPLALQPPPRGRARSLPAPCARGRSARHVASARAPSARGLRAPRAQ